MATKIFLKKGDLILLRKSNNGAQWAEGSILVIVAVNVGSYLVKTKDNTNSTFTVYETSPADDFCLADRKEQATYVKKQISAMKNDIKSLEEELNILEKYDSEEEYMADKLLKLINAKDQNAIVEILKVMKKSHYL